jgi:glycosyltransferase involved in cell wall biosynthesis
MTKPFRLGVIFTHPTQHHSPLWQRLAKEKDLSISVFYLSDENAKSGSGDKEMGTNQPWDIDVLSGYTHQFLKNWTGDVSPKVRSSIFAPSLFSLISKKNFDAIWVSSFVNWSYRLAFLLCKMRGVKIISQNDGTLMAENGYFGLTNRRLRFLLYPSLFNLTDYWLTTGNHNEIYLRHYGIHAAKMRRAPYPFDKTRFEQTIAASQEKIAALRTSFQWDEHTILYGFAGKWIDRKKPMDFIDAIERAHQKDKRIRGLLIGGGELTPQIEARLAQMKGEVLKVGFVNQGALPLYYAAMDVFVCPSLVDSHPLVVSEAMSAGCPVILSDRCGNWGYNDVLEHNRNGIVYPCGNVEALASAMLTLADTNTRQTFSQLAKEIVQNQDLEQTAQAVLSVINDIKAGTR